jgi:hypothetical protein
LLKFFEGIFFAFHVQLSPRGTAFNRSVGECRQRNLTDCAKGLGR